MLFGDEGKDTEVSDEGCEKVMRASSATAADVQLQLCVQDSDWFITSKTAKHDTQ